jgi:hypothetical protein
MDKLERFRDVAREIYTKEYLGIYDMGKDPQYEDELTEVASIYLMSIFYDPDKVNTNRELLIKTLDKKEPKCKSNLIRIIL